MHVNAKTITAVILFFILSGCSLTPGSHYQGVESVEQLADFDHELSKVNLQLIDSALLNQLNTVNKKPSLGGSVAVNTANYEYLLGVGDVLSITVWNHPELTLPTPVQRSTAFDGYRVQADGTITYAYAPNVVAAGRTVSAVRNELISRLNRVIEAPQIDLKVLAYKSQKAYVTGEVQKPGIYPITEIPLTLIDAINQAGGLTEQANWHSATFTRGNETEHINLDDFYSHGDISQNRLLQHGDIVHVARNNKQRVYVLGDVHQAGSVAIDRHGLNLAQALTNQGGLNERSADANGIFVLRKRDLETDGIIADVYQLHAKNVAAYVLAEQFQLQANDIIYVTSAPLTRWNRVISLLLPSLVSIDSTVTVN
ncbi:polysaccharide export protein [Pseudoalteromonas mariniglutinosa]|uniref:polysaccharide export protein n=1 Tax=Pseudoalteromonas mariniglutinosa TaxID=206042 RepID=UPI00384C869A